MNKLCFFLLFFLSVSSLFGTITVQTIASGDFSNAFKNGFQEYAVLDIVNINENFQVETLLRDNSSQLDSETTSGNVKVFIGTTVGQLDRIDFTFTFNDNIILTGLETKTDGLVRGEIFLRDDLPGIFSEVNPPLSDEQFLGTTLTANFFTLNSALGFTTLSPRDGLPQNLLDNNIGLEGGGGETNPAQDDFTLILGTPVPEPATWLLLVFALGGMSLRRK